MIIKKLILDKDDSLEVINNISFKRDYCAIYIKKNFNKKNRFIPMIKDYL